MIDFTEVAETAREVREDDIPQVSNGSEMGNGFHSEFNKTLSDAFKELGLMKELANNKEFQIPDKDHVSDYLEKGKEGSFFDKLTGKEYESVEKWEKAQETLADRLDGIARYCQDKAEKEWEAFNDIQKNGGSETEKWEHYCQSKEYHRKEQDCMQEVKFIREKLAGTDVKTESDILEVRSPIQNKIDGLKREKEVFEELKKKYRSEDGFTIIPEAYLRDKEGKIVRDPQTGEARRVDFVVVKDGSVVDSIEVTSKTADKTFQFDKEDRIRESGGNYIRDNNGNLAVFPSSVKTKIERRD